ncbi:MAG: hypothetical protein WA461_03510 [Nitrososphaeraceae archaeon]
MTLQNLSRILDKYEQQFGSTNTEQFQILKGLSFYNWNNCRDIPANQAQTDFNHAIGLPRKNDMPCPLHDYEQLLYDTLQSNKHIWIKKAAGLGARVYVAVYGLVMLFEK